MMTLQPATSTSQKYFVLADSHAKFVPRVTTTPTYQIIVESISGLKWIDERQHHLSALHLFQTHSTLSHLTSSNAVMFLIGSNSLRTFPAPIVINQIQYLINSLRQQHPHLAHKSSIGIVTTFPCFKTSYSFPTPASLQHNINLFNEQLFILATSINITIVDFVIQPFHLSTDQLHIHQAFSNIVSNNIFNYFANLNPTSLTTCQKVSCRSNDALKRRNRRRHLRLTEKQTNFYICRAVHHSWTLIKIKTYLQQNEIHFAKLAPIRNNQLQIRFNNSQALQIADSMLPQDIFSSQTFS